MAQEVIKFEFELPVNQKDLIDMANLIVKKSKELKEKTNDENEIMKFAGIVKEANSEISDDLKNYKLNDKEYLRDRYGIL
ncbi:MAG: hypothetical protein GX282_01875 [Campylobacteraceae bacterium]|nr:hypothetical protein [Campylobacteraceae bacterium]